MCNVQCAMCNVQCAPRGNTREPSSAGPGRPTPAPVESLMQHNILKTAKFQLWPSQQWSKTYVVAGGPEGGVVLG